jgi:hypothetical protein
MDWPNFLKEFGLPVCFLAIMIKFYVEALARLQEQSKQCTNDLKEERRLHMEERKEWRSAHDQMITRTCEALESLKDEIKRFHNEHNN